MKENPKREERGGSIRRSLSAKTVRSTILSCVVFGLVSLLVALTFYAVSMTRQYISFAGGIANHAALSAQATGAPITLTDEVMEIFGSLNEEQRQQAGTEEYRAYFESVGTGAGSQYYSIMRILTDVLSYHNIFDVYLAMYDRESCAMVYVADPDPSEDRLMPGDWEPVNEKGMLRFLNYDGKGDLYDIDWTENYGLLCTVGTPLRNADNEIRAFMLVDISIENILYGMAYFALRLIAALILVTVLLAWLQTRRIKRTVVTPVNQIAQAAQKYAQDRQEMADSEPHFARLEIRTGDEIEHLGNVMADMEQELTEYEENLKKITAEKERIGAELSLAKQIQTSMLPHEFPPFPDRTEFDIYAVMEPARQVGGDFYDFFLIDSDRLCLVIADVSGKGIPAALFMMNAKTILQSCAMLGISAAEILTRTNETLCANNNAEMFVTVWLGILDIPTGTLTAANAGHEYPALRRADGSFELLRDRHGLVLGGMEGSKYREYTVSLQAGDRLFVYTDGVPEATDAAQAAFGTDRMLDALNREPDAGPAALLRNVRAAVGEFVKDAEQFDDLTMLCIEYRGGDGSAPE